MYIRFLTLIRFIEWIRYIEYVRFIECSFDIWKKKVPPAVFAQLRFVLARETEIELWSLSTV